MPSKRVLVINITTVFLLGLALDLPLLKWLQNYTFPAESRFSDLAYARRVYESCVDMTLTGGTTTANYMATIHREATETLCDIAEERGQRALIGKVCMNRNGFGGYVERSAKDSLDETRTYLGGVTSKKLRLVEPTVVPRFAISCDKALMIGLGEIAEEYGARIHTHLAETKPEVSLLMLCEWPFDMVSKCTCYAMHQS